MCASSAIRSSASSARAILRAFGEATSRSGEVTTNTGPLGRRAPARRSRNRTTRASGHQRRTSPGQTPVTAITGRHHEGHLRADLARVLDRDPRLAGAGDQPSIDAPFMSASRPLIWAGSRGTGAIAQPGAATVAR